MISATRMGKNNFIYVFFLFLLVTLALSAPFWVLGENSSLGWFDELNMSLPLYYYHELNDYRSAMPDFMGGTEKEFIEE